MANGLALSNQREEEIALGMRLGMFVEAAVVLMSYCQSALVHRHVELVEICLAVRRVHQDETYALVVIKVGVYDVDAPEVGDGERSLWFAPFLQRHS